MFILRSKLWRRSILALIIVVCALCGRYKLALFLTYFMVKLIAGVYIIKFVREKYSSLGMKAWFAKKKPSITKIT